MLYVLNRDSLGGYKQGPSGGDAVVSKLTIGVPVFSHASVWPGDGGYIYLATSGAGLKALKYGVGGNGAPLFSAVGGDPSGWIFRQRRS